MLIAFTSIILGLSTTFYVYCQRGMEDSQAAVRLAQQRLALNAALSYALSRATVPPYAGPPMSAVLAAAGTPQSLFVLQDPTIPRTKSLGWFRIVAADAAYVTANYMGAPYNVTSADNCGFITAGAGQLAGQQLKSNDPLWKDTSLWKDELRSWYLVEFDALPPVPPATQLKRLVKLPGPPQTGTGAGTVFLW